MKRKRVIALLTALTMLAGLITGCGASGETQETAEPAAAQEEAGEETLAEESSETASAEGAEAGAKLPGEEPRRPSRSGITGRRKATRWRLIR